MGQPPPAPSRSGRRPGAVTAAAVILITVGALLALFGLLLLLVGSQWRTLIENPGLRAQIGDLPRSFGSVVVIFGAILAAFGLLEIVSGVYVLLARAWARITGIVASALLGLLWLLNVISPSGRSLFPLLFLVASGYVVWALAANGRYFRRE